MAAKFGLTNNHIMNLEADNKVCAELMGYEYVMTLSKGDWIAINVTIHKGAYIFDQYNPHDNMNQLAEVVDKIMSTNEDDEPALRAVCFGEPIKECLRDFVASCLGIEDK